MKKLFGRSTRLKLEPTLVPHTVHKISRTRISPNAIKVVKRLQEGGFEAYLVGGSVRDLLLGRTPKDFDVATNAKPEQIKALIRNCLLIGRRFRLAHVRFGREIIEVATFRALETHKFNKHRHVADHGMITRDNVYGTMEEDAQRRDFTVNALYYNIADDTVIDYCAGMADIHQKTLRLIGEPEKRFREDPVRLLRIIRFAGKLNFHVAPETALPITKLATLLQNVPPARLFEEILKLFYSGHSLDVIKLLREYGLFTQLFPDTETHFNGQDPAKEKFLKQACINTDARIQAEKTVSPAFLFATLLWHPLQVEIQNQLQKKINLLIARDTAAHDILAAQKKRITIPRRYTQAIREIWSLQHRLEKRTPKIIRRILEHPRFRAAYDFLLLRAESGEPVQGPAQWWSKFQESNSTEQEKMIAALPKISKRKARA